MIRLRSFVGGALRALGAAAALACLPAAASGEPKVDFDGLASGTFLTNQLRNSHGVTFPDGVVVRADARARSAPNLGDLPLDGEFAAKAFNARFEGGQGRVTVAFRANRALGSTHDATLVAYDRADVELDAATLRFTADETWRTLVVADGGSAIRRVVLRSTRVGDPFPTNFLFVDDIEYTTVPPPPPPDTIAPFVVIVRPTEGAVVASATVPVEVYTRDAGLSTLQSVSGAIARADSGDIVGRMDFCGSAASGPCPPAELSATLVVELEPAAAGGHTATVVSCDDAGNCSTTRRSFVLDPPPPPPDVVAHVVEINQGVQPFLFDVGRPGTSQNGISAVRLVAARATVVRFYPLAVGADRPGYAARVHARVTYRDGSVAERWSMPNAGVAAVDVVADPGSDEARALEYLRMRPDRRRTLNYVVPGELLQHATFLEVSLEDAGPVTGWLRVSLRPELRVAIEHLEVWGPGIGGTNYPTAERWENALAYVAATYPVSSVAVVPSVRAWIADDGFCEIFSSAINCAVWQFSFYDPPGVAAYSGHPTHQMKLGRLPFDTFSGNNGVALWGSALSKGYGDTYAHEIGHTAGRPHAGGMHGEAGGEAWPFFHGRVAPTDFGVVTERLEAPGPSGLGRWNLTVVDPCPGAAPADRLPECANPDGEATHDLLSYGSGTADVGPLALSSIRNRWVSSYTWNRLYEVISTSPVRIADGAAGLEAGGTDHVEAMLVDAVLREHGPAQPLPVLRLSVPAASVADPPAGPYSLEMYGPGGALLYSRSFDAGELHDSGVEGEPQDRVFLLGQVVPYQPGLQRIVVKKGGATVMVRTGSAHPPQAAIVYPNGGEILASGVHEITWTVADEDGDAVLSRVEYSSDGGRTWGTLGMVAAHEPKRLEVDVDDLPPSADARFRVSASDGFHTAADASDCPVAVGAEKPAECGGPQVLTVGIDVKPRAASDCVNPRREGVVPAAVLGSAELDAAAVDPLSLELAGIRVRMRGDGRPQCDLRDASGPGGVADGIADLVCHFDNAYGGWDDDQGLAVLYGALLDGTPITGAERICRERTRTRTGPGQ